MDGEEALMKSLQLFILVLIWVIVAALCPFAMYGADHKVSVLPGHRVVVSATQPAKLYDGCLFAHKPFKGIPRVGRIFPQSLWPNWTVTADLPPQENVVAQAKACVGCDILYVDEFNCAAWSDLSPNNAQATLDRLTTFVGWIRAVVGPNTKIVLANWPIYADSANRNQVLPWLAGVPQAQAWAALRWQYDVIDQHISYPSKLKGLIDGVGLECYFTNSENQYLPDEPEDAAFSARIDFALLVARSAGLTPYPMIRIVMPDGTAVPASVCATEMQKFAGMSVIVWEGETVPPSDAPMFQLMKN